jgi:hypothetical protein
MITRKKINDFYNGKRFAVAGVSRNPKKFGHAVFKDLKENGYDIVPVNPHAESILDTKCYKDIASLPTDLDRLLICTNKQATTKLVQQAIDNGIKHLWIQQGSHTKETLELAQNTNINLIYGKCIFMFAEPVKGFHKFHRNILRFFGRLPK